VAIDRRIIEAIEACRPGSGDLRGADLADVARLVDADPEVRGLYDRVQHWDAAVTSAMQEVSVPAGLAERILARLNAERAPQNGALASLVDGAASAAASHDASATVVEIAPATRRSRLSRRQWLAGFATLAAMLLVAALVSSWLPSSADVPMEDLAAAWFEELTENWQDPKRVPSDFAVPSAVLAAPTGWQWITSRAGGGGVAYQLQDARGATAMLYVMQMGRRDLPSHPPAQPQSTTLGKAVGYWQSGNRVYVLVVAGDERDYRSFIAATPAPLA
jgi:hypothetical protein